MAQKRSFAEGETAAPLQLQSKSARRIAESEFRARRKQRGKKKPANEHRDTASRGVPRQLNGPADLSSSTERFEVISQATVDTATGAYAGSISRAPGKLDGEALSHIQPGVIIYIYTSEYATWAGAQARALDPLGAAYETAHCTTRPMLIGTVFRDNHDSFTKINGWAISIYSQAGIARIVGPERRRSLVWIKKEEWDDRLNQLPGTDPLTLAAAAAKENWSRHLYLDLASPVSCDRREIDRIVAYVEVHSFAKLRLDLVEQSIALAREANDLTAISGPHRYYFPARSTKTAGGTPSIDAVVGTAIATAEADAATGARPYNAVLAHVLSKCEPSLHGFT